MVVEYLFCAHLVQKKNCLFKVKFGSKTNLNNMQNSIVMFTFFCFRWETCFLGKFTPKNQNLKLKLKFGT